MAEVLLGPSEEQLRTLLEDTNRATMPAAESPNQPQYTFSAPRALTDDVSGKNTAIDITAVPNTYYTGSVNDIKYNRLDIGELYDVFGQKTLIVGENPTTASIVQALNDNYGLSLDESDYIDTPFVPDENYPEGQDWPDHDGEPYTLVMLPTSLAYIGQITLSVQLNTVLLSEVITVTDLDGLNWPELPEEEE